LFGSGLLKVLIAVVYVFGLCSGAHEPLARGYDFIVYRAVWLTVFGMPNYSQQMLTRKKKRISTGGASNKRLLLVKIW